MKACNYIPLEIPDVEILHPLFDDLLDLDVLCTEEGVFINVPERK